MNIEQQNAKCSRCGKDRGVPENKVISATCADCLNLIEKSLSRNSRKRFEQNIYANQ